MDVNSELSSRINRYLRRRATLRETESWLVPRLPLYLQNPNSGEAQLAGALELLLSELHAGLRTERSLRAALRRYHLELRTVWVRYPSAEAEDTATSSSVPGLLKDSGLPLIPQPVWNIEYPGVS
jgi:hypothetical protein